MRKLLTFPLLIILFSCQPKTKRTCEEIDKKNYQIDSILLLDSLNKTISLDTDNYKNYYERGLIYLDQKKYEDALIYFDKSININPNNPKAYHKRAITKFHLVWNTSDYNGYWEDFDKAIKLEPDYAEAYYDRGNIKNIFDNKIPQKDGCDDICKSIKLGYPKTKNRWNCNCDK